MSTKQNRNISGLPVAISSDGRFVAVVDAGQLSIERTCDDQSFSRPVSLHERVSENISFLQWSKPWPRSTATERGDMPHNHQRLLCASRKHISICDAEDEEWAAEIDSGDGTIFAHVDFSSSPDEVIAITEFSTQLMIFSLTSGEKRVIKAPKFAGKDSYAFRPGSGHLALLLKLDSGDVLSIHELETYEAITTTNIPTTNVQGMKWSPDGNWLAVWDSASAGTKVVIYTADGQFFRTYEGSESEIDFGIKTIEWSADAKVLAVGKHNGTVELINGATFTLLTVLGDPISFKPIGRDVYIEQVSADTGREYILAPQSPVFPYTYNIPGAKRVISQISFSPAGKMIATVDKGLPHIVWMWLVENRSPQLIGALVQKSSVKELLWHPEVPELLMTTGDDEVPTVHQWMCGRAPRVATLPAPGGKHETSWITVANKDTSGLFWFGWQTGYMIGYMIGPGPLTQVYRLSSLDERHSPLSEDDFPMTGL